MLYHFRERAISFLAGVLLLLAGACTAQASQPELPIGPLIVDENSRLVVMEYENWFGPKAVTFQGTAAMPFLQSADMRPVGGGYDSADPHVIQQHVEWFEYLGIDAALIEVTNNVSCIFNTEYQRSLGIGYSVCVFPAEAEHWKGAAVREIDRDSNEVNSRAKDRIPFAVLPQQEINREDRRDVQGCSNPIEKAEIAQSEKPVVLK